jgi:hypothetical protein
MRKNILFLLILLITVCNAKAQWNGSANSAGAIYRDGNVGIGNYFNSTLLPAYPLDIRSNQNMDVRIYAPATDGPGGTAIWTALRLESQNVKGLFRIGYPYTGLAIGTTNNIPVTFISSDKIRMIIKGDGNIGIGTVLNNNPNNYKLAVQGRIGAQEVQVENTSTTWADYVFESGYNLMTLKDLESYVNCEKHLPEIPSADDVKAKGGHNLGEMDVLLLKKIEELTLYLIEQDKKIQALQKDNADQKKQIESLLGKN